MQVNTSMKEIIDIDEYIHTVYCSCGHKYKIDELQDGEVREVTCPNCKAKRRIGKLQMKK